LQKLDEQRHHPFTLMLRARTHLICLADPSSSPKDVAAACEFFNRHSQIRTHVNHLEVLAEQEGGAIETISQAEKDAPEIPSFLSNELFSLDAVLAPQLAGVNISKARERFSVHLLVALLPLSIAQGNLRETIKILNHIDSTAIWPSHIPSASHLRQHRGAVNASAIFSPFSKGSGSAIIQFSQFSTVVCNIPITGGSKAYFEVHVLSSGESPQFGLATDKFSPCFEYSGDGVGDDAHSWGVDGVRHQIWHKGGSPADLSWSEGDTVGFDVDSSLYECVVTVNGRTVVTLDISNAKGDGLLGTASALFPAFTGRNCCIKVNFGEDPFRHSTHSERLMTAPPPPVLAPLLVEVVAKYLQLQDHAHLDSPVSLWNLSENSTLRRNLSLDQMWQIAKLCPSVVPCASFIEGLFSRQSFAPQGPKIISGSPQHVLQICDTAEAVVRLLPNQHSGIALALTARVAFNRIDAMMQLGTCDAALLEQYLKMKRSHFLELGCIFCIFMRDLSS
jgi:hypothetical protein